MYGAISQVCQLYGWTYDYVLREIDWRVVNRLLIDSPKVVYDKEDTGDSKRTIFEQSADKEHEFVDMLRRMSNQ